MRYHCLGNTDIEVSIICLGTMTWGEQNDEKEAHQQLDYAFSKGVNFIDTAEMYPVPPRQQTQGLTEAYIGSWLASKPKTVRIQLVLATKVSGPGMLTYLRGGPQLTRKQMEEALHGSLKRLQTDHIDLYQVHWPSRQTNFFGQLGYTHKPDDDAIPIEDILSVLDDFVKAGKVRHIGISNETPWGTMRWLNAARQNNQARIVSIQNPYNLLNRTFEIGSAEVAHREAVGLLAYSPLAFGVLSGKYLNGQRPSGARLTRYEHFDRYSNENGACATEQYVALAKAAGMDPAQMALAYVNSRSFVTANIIGATTMQQLESNIASIDLELPDDMSKAIEQIHKEVPNPCP